ncbi:hypothetical protein VTK73DRAFT_485 [Phialemonium thermophilum]|uniref:Uncharacterized protein n=1 Tax=Phialemonium thermophilum TaxID=223376 RepID=A0ABR3VUZ3_9PEZI
MLHQLETNHVQLAPANVPRRRQRQKVRDDAATEHPLPSRLQVPAGRSGDFARTPFPTIFSVQFQPPTPGPAAPWVPARARGVDDPSSVPESSSCCCCCCCGCSCCRSFRSWGCRLSTISSSSLSSFALSTQSRSLQVTESRRSYTGRGDGDDDDDEDEVPVVLLWPPCCLLRGSPRGTVLLGRWETESMAS